MRSTILLLLLVLGSGCHDRGPPAPSRDQATQLDDAEDMLNDLAVNEEGPADFSASPSNSPE